MAPTPSPWPRRHGSDRERARQATALLLGQARQRGDMAPDPAAFDHLGQGLLMGDAPADAVIAWVRAQGTGTTWPRVQALIDHDPRTQGALADALPADMPPEVRDFFTQVNQLPDWVDPALLDEGARVCGLGGMASLRALLVTGLMAGYQLSAINRTLLATGALEKGASRRMAETTQWWMQVTAPGAMLPGGEGFRSTLKVRLIHAMVRSHVGARPDWDAADLGVPVCQTDMQATYLGFSVVFLLGMKLVGIHLNRGEREAVMHLWRWIAWVNGVDGAYLHDLKEGEASALKLLYRNLLLQRGPDADSARLATALADEPLHRHYPFGGAWMGRFNRSLQLSIARVCMDTATLRALGLPTRTLPWYPVFMNLKNLPLHALARLTPGGRAWLMRRGRRQQLDYLPVLFGSQPKGLHDPQAVQARQP